MPLDAIAEALVDDREGRGRVQPQRRHLSQGAYLERELFIGNLPVRIHSIIEMI